MNTEEIAVKLEKLDQRTQSMGHRIDELETMQKSINGLTISVNNLANSMNGMLAEQKDQGERLKKLEAEPAERWNSMQKTIFNSMMGAIASALGIGLIYLIAQFI